MASNGNDHTEASNANNALTEQIIVQNLDVGDENSPECDQVKKRKKHTSKVWLQMTKMEDGSAQCNQCKKLFVAESHKGTSHLIRHLVVCKKRVIPDIRKYSKLGSSTDTDGATSLTSFIFDWDKSRKAIANFLVCAKLHFTIVELPAFRQMLQTLTSESKTISRHTIKRDVMAIHSNEQIFVMEEMAKAPGKIALTSDNWRAEHTDDEYMCITAHWIDVNWKLQKRIICFKAISLPFTGISLADEVASCLSAWKIDEKISSITLDNASYNDVMATYLKMRSSISRNLVCDGIFFQIRCSCHILNLIVQVGMKKVDNVIAKIQDGVKFIKKSAPRRRKFYDMAENNFNLVTARKLRTDMCVRWKSTFLMLEHAIYYQKVFQHWGERDHSFGIFMLSNEEWDKVKLLHKFLKPFYDATLVFSSTKNPTSNIYFKGVCKIHLCLFEAYKNPPDFMADMISDMVVKFQKYWDEYNLLLACAVVLDPREKLIFVEYVFHKLFNNADEHVGKIVNTLHAIFEHYKESNNVNPSSVDIDEFDDFTQFKLSKRQTQVRKSELDIYLEEPTEEMVTDINILDYWKSHAVRFPRLAAMAQDILAIPISTVASESTFSIGKKVINPWRSSLSRKTIEALVCLEDWHRAKGFTWGDPQLDDATSSDDEIGPASTSEDIL